MSVPVVTGDVPLVATPIPPIGFVVGSLTPSALILILQKLRLCSIRPSTALAFSSRISTKFAIQYTVLSFSSKSTPYKPLTFSIFPSTKLFLSLSSLPPILYYLLNVQFILLQQFGRNYFLKFMSRRYLRGF